MSETVSTAPAAPAASPVATPGAPTPDLGTGPASGTPPAAPETAAPAASSSDAAPAAEASPTEPAKPTSVLSEAKATAETPEKPADAPAAEAPPPEPKAAPTYEAFKFPDGVKPDDTQLASFTTVLGEFEQRIADDPTQAHAIAQEYGQKFIDLYATEAKANAERWAQLQTENWNRTREAWIAEGKKDREIGGNRFDTTILRAGKVLEMYGRQVGAEHETALRDVLGMTGAGDNPKMWRFMDWVARRVTETSRPVAPTVPKPPVNTGSRASRLYRTSANGAA